MTAKIIAALRGPLLALAFLSLSAAFALGAPDPEARAQAPPSRGGPEGALPVLGEKEFVLFLDMEAAREAGEDVYFYCDKNNISLLYASSAAVKIIANGLPPDSGALDELVSKYGQSAVFNESEKRLLDKYVDQIRKTVKPN
jgi:hypothetical protein